MYYKTIKYAYLTEQPLGKERERATEKKNKQSGKLERQ